jgi:hypothetical protein
MPGEDDNIDNDDDLELEDTLGAEDDEDGLEAIIRKALGDQDGDEEEDLLGEFKEPDANTTVSVEEGLDLIDAAQQKQRKGEKDDAAEGGDQTEKPEDKSSGNPDGDQTTAQEQPPELESLLEGLPEDKRTAISTRIAAGDAVLNLFKGHEEELKQHGEDPGKVVARLLDLNQFAQAHPDEYLVWVAQQVSPNDPTEHLAKAAERLGFKLVKADAEAEGGSDDPFEDEEVKRLREENRRLKGETQLADIGPDTPARKAERELRDFVLAKDQSGQLIRPLWPYVQAEIGAASKKLLEESGKPVTLDDIDRLYKEATSRLQGIVKPAAAAETPAAKTAGDQKPADAAAQRTAPVADQKAKDAAALEKSKRASKSIDGAGPGAGRRPALNEDADLEATIRHFAKVS